MRNTTSFHVLVGHLDILLCEMPLQVFHSIEGGGCFSFIYWFIEVLKYILYVRPLLGICVETVFSQSVACLLTL